MPLGGRTALHSSALLPDEHALHERFENSGAGWVHCTALGLIKEEPLVLTKVLFATKRLPPHLGSLCNESSRRHCLGLLLRSHAQPPHSNAHPLVLEFRGHCHSHHPQGMSPTSYSVPIVQPFCQPISQAGRQAGWLAGWLTSACMLP